MAPSNNSVPASAGKGLSLYASLLAPKSGSINTISREPVLFGAGAEGSQQDEAAAKKQINAGSDD